MKCVQNVFAINKTCLENMRFLMNHHFFELGTFMVLTGRGFAYTCRSHPGTFRKWRNEGPQQCCEWIYQMFKARLWGNLSRSLTRPSGIGTHFQDYDEAGERRKWQRRLKSPTPIWGLASVVSGNVFPRQGHVGGGIFWYIQLTGPGGIYPALLQSQEEEILWPLVRLIQV